MAGHAGQDAVLKKNGVAIAGVRVSNLTATREGINVKDGDSVGLDELLAGKYAKAALSFSTEGVQKGDVLRGLALDLSQDALLTDLTFEFAGGGSIAGDFWMGEYTEGAPYEGEVTFTASFSNSKAWTYTAAV